MIQGAKGEQAGECQDECQDEQDDAKGATGYTGVVENSKEGG